MLSYEFKQRLRQTIQDHLREEGDSRLETVFRFLLLPRMQEGDPVGPGTLALVQSGQARSLAFLVPQGGGLVLAFEGVPVQILTLESPLGSAIAGHSVGDQVQVEMTGGRPPRIYQILEVC